MAKSNQEPLPIFFVGVHYWTDGIQPMWPNTVVRKKEIMQISNRVGVLLADDSRILRKAVTCLLESEPTITIVAEAENFSQTVAMADALKPDIVLLDLHMPDHDVFAPEFVKSKLLVCGSLVLGMSFCVSKYDDEVCALAESFGAVALLDKGSFGDELIPAILRLGASPSSRRALLRQEVHSHDLTAFIDEPPSVARGGQDVVVPGCPARREQSSAIGQFLDHLSNHVLSTIFRRHRA